MQRIVMLGLALMVALSVTAVGAVSVSATGHEFVASKTGKTKGKQTDAQVFKTTAGTLECNFVSGSGEITELKSALHKETLTYSGCSAFGYSTVNITPAHFEFSANGSIRLEKSITIIPEGASCEIVIPAQTVSEINYKNESGGKIKATANAFKITSKGTGHECGGEEKGASYTGSVLSELEGGTIEWK
jgi:hypothetical protein